MNRLYEILTILLEKKLPLEICNKIIYECKCLSTPSSICIRDFLFQLPQTKIATKHICRNYVPECNNHYFKTIEIIEIKFCKNCFNKRIMVGYHYPEINLPNKKTAPGIKYFAYFPVNYGYFF